MPVPHAITREGVYEGIPSGRRIRMHAALAELLRRRGDPELLTDLAHHARVAAALGPETAALASDDLAAAARQAELRHAFDEALPLWQQAVDADTASRRDDSMRRYSLLRGTTAAQFRLADIEGARTSVDAAIEAAHALGRWDLVAEAATSFAGAGSWSWRAFGVTDEAMISTLRQCLDHLDDDTDGALKARVLACLQMEHYFGFDAAVADDYGRRSVELARRTGDPDVLVSVCAGPRARVLGVPHRAAARVARRGAAEPAAPRRDRGARALAVRRRALPHRPGRRVGCGHGPPLRHHGFQRPPTPAPTSPSRGGSS